MARIGSSVGPSCPCVEKAVSACTAGATVVTWFEPDWFTVVSVPFLSNGATPPVYRANGNEHLNAVPVAPGAALLFLPSR